MAPALALLPTNVCGRQTKAFESLGHHIIEKDTAGWFVQQQASGFTVMLQNVGLQLGQGPTTDLSILSIIQIIDRFAHEKTFCMLI